MRIVVYSSRHPEKPWDWRDLDQVGGSEAHHIEIATRLEKRGHNIISFTPTPDVYPQIPKGLICRERFDDQEGLKNAQRTKALWIINRDPNAINLVPQGCPAWLVCHDIDYPELCDDHIAEFTRIIALCDDQAQYLLRRHPSAAGKIHVCPGGIDGDKIYNAVIQNVATFREPKRLIFASSPVRGLYPLLQIFTHCLQVVPDLELDIYYGFDEGYDSATPFPPDHQWPGIDSPARLKAEVLDTAARFPQVKLMGRRPKSEVLRAFASAGIWCQPSQWWETCCVTAMEAQALGAIPIVNPIWGIGQYVNHGVSIEGDPVRDSLTRARYHHEILKLATNPVEQDTIRRKMMPWAREQYDWERVVDKFEQMADWDLNLFPVGRPARSVTDSEIGMEATHA